MPAACSALKARPLLHLRRMSEMGTLRVLICPLNWGLGHAARSLALAEALVEAAQEHVVPLEVHWASDGDAAALLRRELPEAQVHNLPGARIRYPTGSLRLNVLRMAPRLAWMMLGEWRATQVLQGRFAYDLIISDNRFGCRVAGVPSWIMTHQVHLPLGDAWLDRGAKVLNHWLLRGFDRVLVPDYAGTDALAGAMSRPLTRKTCVYLGAISRFAGRAQNPPLDTNKALDASERIWLLVLLSGPEPQRSLLEDAVLTGLWQLDGGRKVLLVRGLPRGGGRVLDFRQNPLCSTGIAFECIDFLETEQLSQVLAKAELILCRSGYTTVMDLDCLGRKAIFVPTPGQPEQAVLAKALASQGRGVLVEQAAVGRIGVLAKAVEMLEELDKQGGSEKNGATLIGDPMLGESTKRESDSALRAWANLTIVELLS